MKTLFFLTLSAFAATFSLAQNLTSPHSCKFRNHVLQSMKQGNDQLQLLADNSRSDTIDILNYNITLDITDFTAPDTIWGNTQVQFTPKMNNINTISLDLLELNVDSIELNGNNLSFSYNDTLLVISLPAPHNIGDTSIVTVYYRGVPQGDASGWGGFYFQGGYAFNLGVGFAADPHTYGRVWFPCFDNFVERSTYEFNITTSNGKVAYCNGELVGDTTYANSKRMRTWVLNETIPTYLASVAVAAYTHVNQTFNGINGPIPMWLTALPADTTNLKNSFINLTDAMQAFENGYGPYMWNRVGFTLVPFGSGAMEHATNISYPRVAANGSLTYETLMAHELSHHWWGDLATCETQEDMWLNEGMATYSEFLFTEFVYGQAAYKNAVRVNHEDLVHNAHLKEGGYRAVSGVPHQYTYGDHVYLKGADVAHTLRGYLGDSLFFIGLKAYMANKQFTHASSTDFMNELSAATGVSLTDFFNDWVFNGGWPHFSIDSFNVVQNVPGSIVTIHLKQKITGAPAYFNNVPLEITFMDAQWNMHTETVTMSGAAASFTRTIPVSNPVFVAVNLGEKISHAVAPDVKVLKTAGAANFTNARMNITVQAITDSAFVLVEHNFAAPDPFMSPKPYRISDYRYWNVSGIFPQGFDATAKIYYDGRQNSNYGANYWLDNTLINTTEDSLVLFYRSDASQDWSLFPWYTRFPLTNLNDKYGYVSIDSLLPGQYAFGMRDHAMDLSPVHAKAEMLKVFPNPSQEEITIDLGNMQSPGPIRIMDMTGKMIKVIQISENTTSAIVNISGLTNGLYLIEAGSRRGRFTVLR